MDASIGSEPTNDSHQAVDHSSSSPSTGDAPQMTEHLDEPPRKREIDIKLPQEILDKIWDAALEPWLKKRVIILDCFNWAEEKITPNSLSCRTGLLSHSTLHFTLKCGNPINAEASELSGNVRLVNSKANSTVKLFSSMIARDIFPERPDLSRRHLGASFRAQYVDFQYDVFWLSKDFISKRFQYIWYDRKGQVYQDLLTRDPPQPSHMMLSLRHMLAVMEMVYIRETTCLGGCRPEPIGPDDPLGDFHRVIQIHNRAERLRTLTVLFPQSPDEWNGKVDYEVLEHRPFGTSAVGKASVLQLARTRSNRSHLEQIYVYWSDLISLAANRGYDLPFLQFSRRQS